MTFLPSSGKCFILGRVDEALSHELGLGELAGITVANETENLTYEVSGWHGDADNRADCNGAPLWLST